ncbi:MAG: 50S ribosomal protein L10 [Bacilli bacterium]|jgi:large subunit ribosomal protein L10|nr:50S ribosomal protein L10 [Bacilli bacterium]MCH4210524.1 50S ribosomal protein L10 [Bacilli bacterium]MCH4228093.1 50S ribosomal protein L10 [Bacilli bacterium]MCH4278180.1 50S ribosomal protein L10 [Bacilli bacterium]MCI2054601.1 50S ribosomal protein L10 [Bacilli bacterium]
MNKTVLQQKKATVKEIEDGISSSKTIAVVSYHGLSVSELTELRRSLAEKDSSMGVYKNTLVARAFKELGYTGLDEILEGPNAFVFSKDVTSGAAVLNKFSRYHENLVIKGGLVEGKAVDQAGMKEVAKLPSKEVLLSMFCMVLNEPVAKFARAIKSIADKSGDAASAPAAN